MSKTPIWLIVFERGYLYVTIGYVEHKLSFAENVHGFVFDWNQDIFYKRRIYNHKKYSDHEVWQFLWALYPTF